MRQIAHAIVESTERPVFETGPDACTYARNDDPRILCQGHAPQGDQHADSIPDDATRQNQCDVLKGSELTYSDIPKPPGNAALNTQLESLSGRELCRRQSLIDPLTSTDQSDVLH